MNIGIYVYRDVEVLDFAGPFEVFSTANRVRNDGGEFVVFLVAESNQAVIARHGFSVNPHYDFYSHPPIDLLCIPGGVHHSVMGYTLSRDWIQRTANRAEKIATVCTGAFLLAETGLLQGRKITTHWEDIAELRHYNDKLEVLSDRRWVEDGKFISSGGISAGIDMSLYIVSQLIDRETAALTAKQMEYDWRNNPIIDSD